MEENLWSKNFINTCVANFLLASSFYLFMPTIPIYLVENLQIEHSKIGTVLSSYTLGMLLVRPFSGYFIDAFDRKTILLLSLSLFVASFFGYLVAVAVISFTVIRFIQGTLWGVSTVSVNTVAIDIIPPARRAEGIGYFGMSTNLAMAIAPFIAISIFEDFGFQVLVFCSIGMGILSIIMTSLIKTPVKIAIKEKIPISLDRFILIKALPVFVNQLFVTIGWGMLLAFAILYAKEINISNPGLFFLFLAMGLILSRVISGRFVDRGHIHFMVVIALTIISLGFLSFAYFHTIAAYCISALFIGIGFGTMLPAFQTIFINMAPHDRRGTANSTYMTGFDLGVGIGMFLGGFISESHPMSHLYFIASGLGFCSIIYYLLISRRVYEKRKLR